MTAGENFKLDTQRRLPLSNYEVHLDFLPMTPPRSQFAPLLRALMSGVEAAAALVIVYGGMALVGLATLA
jgi:hypothetical protein